MRVFHRFSVELDRRKEFLTAGLDVSDYVDELSQHTSSVVVRLDETDGRWPQLAKLIEKYHSLDLIETEFSHKELERAAFVRFLSKSFTGFPEPSDDFGFLRVTYDLSEYCEECGIGARQRAPFRISAEPKWGRRQTFQLHWVFEEIFVMPETWQEVFKPFGIGYWPVLNKSGNEYSSVLQLKIASVVELDMPDYLPKQVCPVCRRVKYLPLHRGPWPRPVGASQPIFKSAQYFGDGAAADRAMFISHDQYLAMAKAKLNCRYWACV